jgi:spore maturation protein CgeB
MNTAPIKTIGRVLLIICDTSWMHAHLAASWRMTGAAVFVEDFGSTMGRGWDEAGEREHRERNARWRSVAAEIAAGGGLDLVFMVALDDVLEEATLTHFRGLGANLVLYQVDMLSQWHRSIRSSQFMDLICCASADHVEFFRKRGIPTLRLGFGTLAPASDELNPEPIPYHGVLYMGSPWPYRQRVLRQVVQAGLPLRIYGNNWHSSRPWPGTAGAGKKLIHDLRFYLLPRLREEGASLVGRMARRLIDREQASVHLDEFPAGVVRGSYATREFSALVRGAAINIGFTQMDIDSRREHPRQLRLRDFETPAAGGFYLAQSCPELSLYYDIGGEIVVWDRAADLLDCIRYYLNRPDERRRIADAGRERALRNHTWLHRFADMAKALGMQLPVQAEHELSIA